jgi:hypothetical protein
LLKQNYAKTVTSAAKALNRATLAGQAEGIDPVEMVIAHASAAEADHAARVQWVLGRPIVDFTARGVRTGILAADPAAMAVALPAVMLPPEVLALTTKFGVI